MKKTIEIVNELILLVLTDPSSSAEKKRDRLKYLYERLHMAEYEAQFEKEDE